MKLVALPGQKPDSDKDDVPTLLPNSNKQVRMANAILSAENDRLSRVLETQLTNVDSLMISNTNLRKRFEKLSTDLNSEQHKNMRLQSSNNRLRSQMNDLLEKNLSLSSASRKNRTEIQHLSSKLSQLENFSERMKTQLNTAIKNNRSLVEIITSLRSKQSRIPYREEQGKRHHWTYYKFRSVLDNLLSLFESLTNYLSLKLFRLRENYSSRRRSDKLKKSRQLRQLNWQKSTKMGPVPMPNRTNTTMDSYFNVSGNSHKKLT